MRNRINRMKRGIEELLVAELLLNCSAQNKV